MSRLAVIAGQGRLPEELARHARDQGHDIVIFRITGQADAAFSGFETFDVPLGAIGSTRQKLTETGCTSMVMVGRIRRPSLAELKPDAAAVALLAKAVGRGDDALLRVISDYFAEAGIETLSPDSLMPRVRMPEGLLAGDVDAARRVDIELGVDVLAALGDHDVGQGVVVQDGRVMAIEAAEGTDAMLERAAALLDTSAPAAVFVKAPKAGQDMRLDPPVAGAETLRRAAAAGIGVVALKAGGVILADEPETLRSLADELRLVVIGI